METVLGKLNHHVVDRISVARQGSKINLFGNFTIDIHQTWCMVGQSICSCHNMKLKIHFSPALKYARQHKRHL